MMEAVHGEGVHQSVRIRQITGEGGAADDRDDALLAPRAVAGMPIAIDDAREVLSPFSELVATLAHDCRCRLSVAVRGLAANTQLAVHTRSIT